MTEDVTELFQRYRLCLREIWNTYFWQHPELRNWESVTVFNRLKPSLFQALVLENLPEGCACDPAPPASFQVVPNIQDNKGNRLATRVVVTTSEAGGRDWKEELPTLDASDATLRFVDIFEWSKLDYMDLPYYLAEITAFAARPDLVGFEALIEVQQANVFWLKP